MKKIVKLLLSFAFFSNSIISIVADENDYSNSEYTFDYSLSDFEVNKPICLSNADGTSVELELTKFEPISIDDQTIKLMGSVGDSGWSGGSIPNGIYYFRATQTSGSIPLTQSVSSFEYIVSVGNTIQILDAYNVQLALYLRLITSHSLVISNTTATSSVPARVTLSWISNKDLAGATVVTVTGYNTVQINSYAQIRYTWAF